MSEYFQVHPRCFNLTLRIKYDLHNNIDTQEKI